MEVARDLGRVGGDLREVAVGEDSLGVADREIFLAYQVHSEAIRDPGDVDAIRSMTGLEPGGARSIGKTDAALGLRKELIFSMGR